MPPIQPQATRAVQPEDKVYVDNDTSWLEVREKLVQQALNDEDYGSLRRISALPGGFGTNGMRKQVWPFLLRANTMEEQPEAGPSRRTRDATRHSTKEATADDDMVDDHKGSGGEDQSGTTARADSEKTVKIHKDEGQVLLDTKRSFVSYPKGLPPEHKLNMQADLQDLIVGVLRKYPALDYFQGYHDILSVLYLTYIPIPPPNPPRSRTTSLRTPSRTSTPRPNLERQSVAPSPTNAAASSESGTDTLQHEEDTTRLPSTDAAELARDSPEWQALRRCAEAVSVYRVRDAMGKGMEPMMGLLKILKRILKAADSSLSSFSSQISPIPTLPFFALSWILCLFSHDINTLEPIQRMFDYLLARNPISAIYLAVAILMAKKDEMFVLAKNLGEEAMDDPSLLHPLFARLPPLYPDTPSAPTPPSSPTPQPAPSEKDTGDDDERNPYTPIPLSRLFALTDDLMARYPWDGEVVRGGEIMGVGSAVCTYDYEGVWGVEEMLGMVDREVVKPGAGGMDDEAEAEEGDEKERMEKVLKRRRRMIHLPRDRVGTVLALGVLVLGVGLAVYTRGGTGRGEWSRWWGMVVKSWVGKQGVWLDTSVGVVDGYRKILGYIGRIIKDVM